MSMGRRMRLVWDAGRCQVAPAAAERRPRPRAQVPRGLLAAMSPRAVEDSRVVSQRLPRTTRYLRIDDVEGWFFSLSSEFGEAFGLFAYWDGSSYQVKVVLPEVEGRYNPHDVHLYPDGLICFGMPQRQGMPTLETAFAKSVLWANGFSSFLHTGTFQF